MHDFAVGTLGLPHRNFVEERCTKVNPSKLPVDIGVGVLLAEVTLDADDHLVNLFDAEAAIFVNIGEHKDEFQFLFVGDASEDGQCYHKVLQIYLFLVRFAL